MRRVLSLLGMLIVIALALILLWQVYLHHSATDPDDEENTSLAVGKNFPSSELNHKEIKYNGMWHV